MPRLLRFIPAALFLVLLLLSPLGCGPGYYDFGRLNPSRPITQVFEDNQILEGYQYYMAGTDDRPAAILAIAPGYELNTKIWRAIDPSSGQMKIWMRELTRDPERKPYIRGARVEDFKGNQVGIWFSDLPRTSVIVQGQKVRVDAP